MDDCKAVGKNDWFKFRFSVITKLEHCTPSLNFENLDSMITNLERIS